MNRLAIVVRSTNGATAAPASGALSAAGGTDDPIRRGERVYCPACLDDPHAATCPNLTRTGEG
jgi:hypothetical protein